RTLPVHWAAAAVAPARLARTFPDRPRNPPGPAVVASAIIWATVGRPTPRGVEMSRLSYLITTRSGS
ncbi:MAG: hypothetical protein QF926_02255, partial [Alphaproteobacteria bacterium]|nr:hypothetical protein [Alphaproteobacteria bacterium]